MISIFLLGGSIYSYICLDSWYENRIFTKFKERLYKDYPPTFIKLRSLGAIGSLFIFTQPTNDEVIMWLLITALIWLSRCIFVLNISKKNPRCLFTVQESRSLGHSQLNYLCIHYIPFFPIQISNSRDILFIYDICVS